MWTFLLQIEKFLLKTIKNQLSFLLWLAGMQLTIINLDIRERNFCFYLKFACHAIHMEVLFFASGNNIEQVLVN